MEPHQEQQSEIRKESTVPEKVIAEPPPKPKRVLTEAQRLAFLKGREKRMANIERKRQEKKEAEEEMGHSTNEDVKPQVSNSTPLEPKVEEDVHLKSAEKIASFLFDKIKTLKEETSADPEPPVKKPRKKYTRKPKPEPVEDEHIEDPTPLVAPIPKRSISWM